MTSIFFFCARFTAKFGKTPAVKFESLIANCFHSASVDLNVPGFPMPFVSMSDGPDCFLLLS